jgi:signal transduction histidine kinase
VCSSDLSHELRTPLNSIIGFAQLLQDKLFGSLNTEQEDHVATIIESSNHLLELINDILDLVKLDQHIEKLAPAYLDLEKIFSDLSDLFLPQLRAKSLNFSISVEGALPHPHWDPQKLKQILINIISNAIKFTPQEGSVTLTASQVGEEISISVKDTGVGIPPEMAEKVFLAFVQADSSYTKLYRGVGLGLSISKNLVELHKGKIWLEPNPDGGTIVTFSIPIDPFHDSASTLPSGQSI